MKINLEGLLSSHSPSLGTQKSVIPFWSKCPEGRWSERYSSGQKTAVYSEVIGLPIFASFSCFLNQIRDLLIKSLGKSVDREETPTGWPLWHRLKKVMQEPFVVKTPPPKKHLPLESIEPAAFYFRKPFKVNVIPECLSRRFNKRFDLSCWVNGTLFDILNIVSSMTLKF